MFWTKALIFPDCPAASTEPRRAAQLRKRVTATSLPKMTRRTQRGRGPHHGTSPRGSGRWETM
jgi:hypothetical protein